MHHYYTDGEWAADMASLYLARESPPACPHCGRTGFYGPRSAGSTRRYRGCKFCGFWQNVGERVIIHFAVVHDCDRNTSIAAAPEIQWVAPHERIVKCYGCQQDFEVAGFIITAPSDDPSHPWWNVPQGLSYDDSIIFWQSQGFDRLHL
jgi:hypothetical protein